VPPRTRPENRYELLTCGFKGHVLVGAEAELVTEEDAVVVRELDGLRWCRCLRCDAWVPSQVPVAPTARRVPSRDEIELPLRGRPLRDLYVLRLIAIDRAIHAVVLAFLAVVLLTFARHDAALHADYLNIMNALSGSGAAASRVRGLLGYLRKAFDYSPRQLLLLGLVFAVLAGVEATEMVGLWRARRWAEYLTFIVTSAFLPFEIYELSLQISVFKVVAFVINLAIVAYLLYAKRLFGLRGGHAAEVERQQALGGWEAIERSTPTVPTPANS